MKKSIGIIAILLVFVFTGFAQDESYKMYDVIYIKPKYDKVKELSEAVAKHNKEFHNEGPHTSSVWMVQSGSYSGWWAWIMGPLTYTDLDSRPDSKEHLEDWMGEVMPYIQEYAERNLWKLDDEVSFVPEDSFTGKTIWSNYDIKPFEGYRFTEMLKLVKKVYEEKEYTRSFAVYRAQFDSRNMGSVTISFGFKSWAFFDEDKTFKKDFEEVHGEGSWWKFMEEFKEIVISVEDQAAIFVPELSGGTDEE